MNDDWATDFLIEYEENGERDAAIWSGYTREEAIEEFKLAYPERKVLPLYPRGEIEEDLPGCH